MTPTVPRPEDRISIAMWRDVRAWMLANDEDAGRMLQWSLEERVKPPSPEAMASEIIWIILCAGKSAQAARTIEKKVWAAIDAGKPVMEAFGHRGRAAAIERCWSKRQSLYQELQAVIDDEAALMAWCRALPWVGDITAFQLMKNFGVDCPKPDIWLCRLAGIPDRPAGKVERRFAACRELCRHLGEATGDSLAVVDSLLWLACNKGILTVSSHAGPVAFHPKVSTLRSMHIAAE